MSEKKPYSWHKNLLRKMSATKPQFFIMGGYAEDALLNHKSTREHSDIDVFVMRDQLDEYDKVAKQLGFEVRGTYGETASGEPSYVAWTHDESFWLECLVADRNSDGHLYCELGKLLFDTTGLPPFKPLRIYLPDDTLNQPPTRFEDFEIQTVSPLALYQMRVGLHVHQTFGDLREKDVVSMKALKEQFFAHKSEEELVPRVELV